MCHEYSGRFDARKRFIFDCQLINTRLQLNHEIKFHRLKRIENRSLKSGSRIYDS